MRSATRVILPLVAAIWAVGSAHAQTEPTSWRALLESRVRVSYRYTHPPAPRLCEAGPLPERGYLAAAPHRGPIGRTWQPGTTQSRWEALASPPGMDTLPVRIVALWCGPDGPSVLVEADGYYVEVLGSQLAQVDDAGTLTGGILSADVGAAGTRIDLAIREVCAAGSCHQEIGDAARFAEERLAVLRQREEADRLRLAQGERRAESQAAQRLQTGATVGAQMNAVVSRELAETYQRLGATPEQANAILQRRVLAGMTPAMVRAAIGEPRETRQEPGTRGALIWMYPDRQVVFVDGRVAQAR